MRVHSPASVGARRSPTNAFSSVDLPALTRPAIATRRGPASRSRIDAIWLAYADPAVREASESTSASTWSAADPNPEAVTTVVMPSTPDLLLDRRERGERLGALGGARLAFLLRALHVGLGALRGLGVRSLQLAETVGELVAQLPLALPHHRRDLVADLELHVVEELPHLLAGRQLPLAVVEQLHAPEQRAGADHHRVRYQQRARGRGEPAPDRAEHVHAALHAPD